ncbi:MAG: phosphatidate cytidylyltransferase [Chloroflexi bacterium]|nr:MAG: phosphatidate cytidylyltransferase [Chloroflexota bacterium]
MRQRAISSIGVVVVGIIPALLGSPVFTIVIGFIALGALYELYRAYQRVGAHPSTWTGTLAIAALFVIAGSGDNPPFIALMGAMTGYSLFSLAQHLVKSDLTGSLVDWVYSLSGVMYVGLTMTHFVLLRRIGGADVEMDWVRQADNIIGNGEAALGLAWLLVTLLTTWMTDVFAYMYGRTWGRTKLIPRVSPGKTREGAVAGLVGGILTAVAAGYLVGLPVPFFILILFGLVIAIAGTIGDLMESLIKRQIGIKDMGAIIPGHGGLMDRVDALLVTVPLAYYLALFLDWRGWP